MSLPTLTTSQRSIRLPDDVKERAARWVQTQTATAHRSPSDAPFRRMIDFWFAAIAWAVSHNLTPVEKAQGDKFVSIGPNPNDVRLQPWRSHLLSLLAIHTFGHDDPQAQDPAAIVDLANRYAEAGAEALVTHLESAREFAVPMLYRVTDMFLDEFKRSVEGKTHVY